jgi:hypothetical protein
MNDLLFFAWWLAGVVLISVVCDMARGSWRGRRSRRCLTAPKDQPTLPG